MSAAPAPVASGFLEAAVPPERRGIARDGVRMLVTSRRARTHVHARFFQLPAFLRRGDLLVANDSATMPAALWAHRTHGAPVRLHVSTKIDARLWMVEPRDAVRRGEVLALPGGGRASMLAPADPLRPRVWYAWFDLPETMESYLQRHGEPIRYAYVREALPLEAYQTLFARAAGSSEMPSAGRPFTPRVVRALRRTGIEIACVTLHGGVASFEAPERPSLERFDVSQHAAQRINRARREGRRVVAIGTTVVRALESATRNGEIVPSRGWTDVVVDEWHAVRSVDGLLSGFHDGAATHQWMLRAFLDGELLAQAYASAASEGYYRHEFGDVHLIV